MAFSIYPCHNQANSPGHFDGQDPEMAMGSEEQDVAKGLKQLLKPTKYYCKFWVKKEYIPLFP